MMDCILIQGDAAHQIWRDTFKSNLPPMTPELMRDVVEVEAGTVSEGDLWDGETFSAPPVAPDPRVDGETFMARVTDAEYAAVMAAAQINVQLARWVDQVRILGYVNVFSDAALAAKAALVAAELLTEPRAEAIFAPL